MAGARAVQRSILKGFPEAKISVSIVWIDMLPGDGIEAVRRSAKIVDDPRVQHFHDPKSGHRAGRAFGELLLRPGAGSAWDVYLFYDKDVVWKGKPPEPTEFLHQLSGGRRADPKYFRTGDDLVKGLHEAMKRLTGK